MDAQRDSNPVLFGATEHSVSQEIYSANSETLNVLVGAPHE